MGPQDEEYLRDVIPPYPIETSVALLLQGEKMVLHHWVWFSDAVEAQIAEQEDQGADPNFQLGEVIRMYDEVSTSISPDATE